MKRHVLPMLMFSTSALAQVPEGVKLGGFVDTYYAFDFNQPKNHERSFTTQPVRHNEANVNLAFLEAVLKREKVRGRLALQYGNSVTKNYAGEPTRGSTSGPRDSQMLQESYVGARVGEKTWIDLGIFLGNIGAESWISKDNYTYTRALNLDYVPYYSSGARLEHLLSSNETVQLQLLNGWQNISENNHGKAIGMQYKNVLSERHTFAYNNFFGDEEVTTAPDPRFRAYHNFIWQFTQSERWQFISVFDIGHQSQKENDGVDPWYSITFTSRRALTPTDALALRVEYYNDRHDANIGAGSPNGFQVMSASLNFDRKLEEFALWRTELRGFYSKDEIYPEGIQNGLNRWDGFLVTSLAFWF